MECSTTCKIYRDVQPDELYKLYEFLILTKRLHEEKSCAQSWKLFEDTISKSAMCPYMRAVNL